MLRSTANKRWVSGQRALCTIALMAASVAAACGSPPQFIVNPVDDPCEGITSPSLCLDGLFRTCAGGQTITTENCEQQNLLCVDSIGCRQCEPGAVRCTGETVERCQSDGSMYVAQATCEPSLGERCSPLGCRNLCADAATSRSYLGCEYWATTTPNTSLAPEFSFNVVVGNPQLVPALVTVSRGQTIVAERTVQAGGVADIALPWIEPLFRGGVVSTTVAEGGYRITADVPVNVHQYNPFEHRLRQDCDPAFDGTPDGDCLSFTNDASLLLPTSVLTGSYVVLSRPTHAVETSDDARFVHSGFVTVIATSPGLTHLRFRSTSAISTSSLGPEVEPGGEFEVDLPFGHALQVVSQQTLPDGTTCPPGGATFEETQGGLTIRYCDYGTSYDLTGSEVIAGQPVAVFSGHDCTFVPFNRWACDHLEEQIPPAETLASEYVVAPPPNLRNEPFFVRIVSTVDDNQVSLLGVEVAPFTLARGAFSELELRGPVIVRTTGAALVGQFLVGQDFAGLGASGRAASGDPSMGIIPPTVQFRNEYQFLVPSTYANNFVTVFAPVGATVVYDNTRVIQLTALAGTAFAFGELNIPSGVHRLESSARFGAMLSGFAPYTSYLVPAGLDLEPVSPPIL